MQTITFCLLLLHLAMNVGLYWKVSQLEKAGVILLLEKAIKACKEQEEREADGARNTQ